MQSNVTYKYISIILEIFCSFDETTLPRELRVYEGNVRRSLQHAKEEKKMGSTVLRRYRYERHPDNYQYVTHMQNEALKNMRLIARSKSDVVAAVFEKKK